MARALVVQSAVAHGPADLRITVFGTSPAEPGGRSSAGSRTAPTPTRRPPSHRTRSGRSRRPTGPTPTAGSDPASSNTSRRPHCWSSLDVVGDPAEAATDDHDAARSLHTARGRDRAPARCHRGRRLDARPTGLRAPRSSCLGPDGLARVHHGHGAPSRRRPPRGSGPGDRSAGRTPPRPPARPGGGRVPRGSPVTSGSSTCYGVLAQRPAVPTPGRDDRTGCRRGVGRRAFAGTPDDTGLDTVLGSVPIRIGDHRPRARRSARADRRHHRRGQERTAAQPRGRPRRPPAPST